MSTDSTLPATFCPSLNFFRPLAVPRSEACSTGTNALRAGRGSRGVGKEGRGCKRSSGTSPQPPAQLPPHARSRSSLASGHGPSASNSPLQLLTGWRA